MARPALGLSPRVVVVAPVKRRVGANGANLQGAVGDLVRGGRGADREHDAASHPIGISDRPLQ